VACGGLCHWTHTVCDVTARRHIPVCKPTFWRSLPTSALTFRDFLEWNLWLFWELFRDFLGRFGKVWKCVKWTISVYFGNRIWFYFWHLSQHSDFMLHHWRRRRGCERTVLILWKSGKNVWKSGKIHRKPSQYPWKS